MPQPSVVNQGQRREQPQEPSEAPHGPDESDNTALQRPMPTAMPLASPMVTPASSTSESTASPPVKMAADDGSCSTSGSTSGSTSNIGSNNSSNGNGRGSGSGSGANKPRAKFSSRNLNAVYKAPTTKGGVESAVYPSGNRMLVLRPVRGALAAARVNAVAAPTPINTPSLRKENHGQDVTVNLIPTGRVGWASASASSSTAAATRDTAPVLSTRHHLEPQHHHHHQQQVLPGAPFEASDTRSSSLALVTPSSAGHGASAPVNVWQEAPSDSWSRIVQNPVRSDEKSGTAIQSLADIGRCGSSGRWGDDAVEEDIALSEKRRLQARQREFPELREVIERDHAASGIRRSHSLDLHGDDKRDDNERRDVYATVKESDVLSPEESQDARRASPWHTPLPMPSTSVHGYGHGHRDHEPPFHSQLHVQEHHHGAALYPPISRFRDNNDMHDIRAPLASQYNPQDVRFENAGFARTHAPHVFLGSVRHRVPLPRSHQVDGTRRPTIMTRGADGRVQRSVSDHQGDEGVGNHVTVGRDDNVGLARPRDVQPSSVLSSGPREAAAPPSVISPPTDMTTTSVRNVSEAEVQPSTSVEASNSSDPNIQATTASSQLSSARGSALLAEDASVSARQTPVIPSPGVPVRILKRSAAPRQLFDPKSGEMINVDESSTPGSSSSVLASRRSNDVDAPVSRVLGRGRERFTSAKNVIRPKKEMSSTVCGNVKSNVEEENSGSSSILSKDTFDADGTTPDDASVSNLSPPIQQALPESTTRANTKSKRVQTVSAGGSSNDTKKESTKRKSTRKSKSVTRIPDDEPARRAGTAEETHLLQLPPSTTTTKIDGSALSSGGWISEKPKKGQRVVVARLKPTSARAVEHGGATAVKGATENGKRGQHYEHEQTQKPHRSEQKSSGLPAKEHEHRSHKDRLSKGKNDIMKVAAEDTGVQDSDWKPPHARRTKGGLDVEALKKIPLGRGVVIVGGSDGGSSALSDKHSVESETEVGVNGDDDDGFELVMSRRAILQAKKRQRELAAEAASVVRVAHVRKPASSDVAVCAKSTKKGKRSLSSGFQSMKGKPTVSVGEVDNTLVKELDSTTRAPDSVDSSTYFPSSTLNKASDVSTHAPRARSFIDIIQTPPDPAASPERGHANHRKTHKPSLSRVRIDSISHDVMDEIKTTPSKGAVNSSRPKLEGKAPRTKKFAPSTTEQHQDDGAKPTNKLCAAGGVKKARQDSTSATVHLKGSKKMDTLVQANVPRIIGDGGNSTSTGDETSVTRIKRKKAPGSTKSTKTIYVPKKSITKSDVGGVTAVSVHTTCLCEATESPESMPRCVAEKIERAAIHHANSNSTASADDQKRIDPSSCSVSGAAKAITSAEYVRTQSASTTRGKKPDNPVQISGHDHTQKRRSRRETGTTKRTIADSDSAAATPTIVSSTPEVALVHPTAVPQLAIVNVDGNTSDQQYPAITKKRGPTRKLSTTPGSRSGSVNHLPSVVAKKRINVDGAAPTNSRKTSYKQVYVVKTSSTTATAPKATTSSAA